MNEDSTNLGQVIRIDDERVRDYLPSVVGGSVEETLNALLGRYSAVLCPPVALSTRSLFLPRCDWLQRVLFLRAPACGAVLCAVQWRDDRAR